MKRFKRFISGVFVLVLLSTLILPMLPVLEVKAAVLPESDAKVLFSREETLANASIFLMRDVSTGESKVTQYSTNVKGGDCDYKTVFDSPKDSLNAFITGMLYCSTDKFLQSNVNITGNNETLESYMSNLYYVGSGVRWTEEIYTDSLVHVMVCYNKESHKFNTFVTSAVVSRDINVKETIAMTIAESNELLNVAYLNREYKNNIKLVSVQDIITENISNYSKLINNVLSVDMLQSDVSNPEGIDASKYTPLTYIADYIEVNYTYEGKEKKSYGFKIDVGGTLLVDEKQSGNVYNNKIENGTFISDAGTFTSPQGNKGINIPYASAFIFADLSNADWGNWGDTRQLGNVKLPTGLKASDLKDENERSIFTQSDKILEGDAVCTELGNFIQSLCSTDLSRDDFTDNLVKMEEKIGKEETISKIIHAYRDNMADLAGKWKIQDEQQWVTENADNTLAANASSDYEMMALIIGEAVKQSSAGNSLIGKYITYNNEVYYVGQYFTSAGSLSGAKNLNTVWSNNLTDYQRSSLSVAYKSVCDTRDFSTGILRTVYDYGVKGTYTEEGANELKADVRLNFDSIKTVVTNKDSNLVDNYSVYNIARNANTLGQYIVGVSLYGVGSDESTSIYNLYDATLAGLMMKDYTQSGVNESWFPYKLPANINVFGENTKYYTVLLSSSEDNFEVFTSFLYNVSYAFDVAAFSQGGEEFNYDPVALREYFKSGTYTAGDGYTTDVSFSWFTGNNVDSLNGETITLSDEVSVNMLRSIIELHDLCEFLGILEDAKNGGWTDAIAEYLGIYDDHEPFFNALRNNPYIYSRADVGITSADEPLGVFFNIEDKKMSDQWCKGFAASALYVPMETNLYDATSISYINDPDFISDFYYKYAFYRKALYINTDNSAIVNAKVSGDVSGTRVATLRDLLNYQRDIILTVDDNFYNAKDINSVIGSLDYSAVRNGSSTDTDTGWESLKNWVGDLFDLSPEQILKTGANSYYSSTLADSVTKLGGTPTLTSSIADVYLLSQDDLLGEHSVFDEYEYSVKQSYGVVSAVYRSAELYNECLRALASDNAIFKSSKGICSTPGTNSSDWRSIYNYCMLANLEEQMKNDAASTLDLDAPIFCDLFGNIVTESGLVIIPAAANATLCGTNWNPNTVGWSEYYNNGNRLEIGEFSDEVYQWLTGVSYESNGTATQQVQYVDHYYGDESGETDQDKMGDPVYKTYTISSADSLNVGQYGEEVKHDNAGGYMIVDRSGQLMLRTSSLSGSSSSAIIQWENLNKNSTVVKELFYNDAYFNKAESGGIYSKTLVNLVVETLRGAPIEYIDYEYEGISGNADISKFGVYMAYKLEELTNALISGTNGNAVGGNALITMPNLAFVTGIEYIVLYVFKVVFALMLVGLAISLYLDAVKNHLGIKSVGKFIFTCTLVIVAITLVPNLISWSYYKSNKDLLASESGYIMMLNYVKDYDGAEIGITNVTTPETTTELYVKLDDVSVNWWDVIGEVLFNNTYKTVTELYEGQLKDNAMAMQDNVQLKGDGLYMDVQDIFDSTSIVYYPSQNRLGNITYSNSTSGGTPGDRNSVVSFVLPYYVILDKLVANIDEYNQSKDITAYSWSVGSNGHIMTYDIISPYLTSSEFLDEGFDILGLNEVLQTDVKMTSYTEGYFDNSQITRMKLSKWYPTGSTKDQLTQDRINEIYKYARDYVANNESILGKIPDEVFLKVFALQLSIKFNQVFNVHSGNAIEIMNIDTRDIARLLVSDKGSVYKYYSYGFARFTYEESGTLGVIFSALYFVVLWVTSILKPLLMILILGLLIINVIFRKILFRKESRCVEGYFIGCACLVACNYAYAIMLKVSLSISEYGFGTIVALAVALLVQILYVAGLCSICVIEIKDWKNNGFNEFSTIGASITSNILHAQSVIADKVMSRQNSAYGDAKRTRAYKSDSYDMNSVDEMLDRDEEREENGTYSQI